MRRTYTLVLGLGAVLFFSSCKREESVNIQQERIYTSYDFTFDAEQNRSRMSATFRLDNSGGQKIQLSFPARVEFNGEGMVYRKALGIYELNQMGNQAGRAFTYFDLDDNEFSNSVSAVNSIDLPFGITNISTNGNFFLPWTGAALQSGETVRVTIKGENSRTFTTSLVGSNHIILQQHQLAGLTAGNAQIQIEREITVPLDQSTLAGGRMSMKHISRKAFITITN
jgi:hypothetical protein